VRRTEQRVPEYSAKAMQYPVVVRVDAVQGEGALGRCEHKDNRKHDRCDQHHSRRFGGSRHRSHIITLNTPRAVGKVPISHEALEL